jgi:hypothetical protein
MGHRGKSAVEIQVFNIKKILKKLERNEISIQECELNRRFERLKKDSEPWYDDLYPKYVEIVRTKSLLNTK